MAFQSSTYMGNSGADLAYQPSGADAMFAIDGVPGLPAAFQSCPQLAFIGATRRLLMPSFTFPSQLSHCLLCCRAMVFTHMHRHGRL